MSTSFLSPTLIVVTVALYFCRKQIQRVYFALLYGSILAPRFVVQLDPLKKELFVDLEQLKSTKLKQDSLSSLRILEIGVGPGINLKYYPEGSSLISVEPNPHFESYFAKNRYKFPHVRVERSIKGKAESMDQVEDGSVDVVVSTYVLCSVSCCSAVLKEVVRVLKPGGRFLYLEHNGFPEGSWERLFQTLIQPLWGPLTDGCNLTTDISSSVMAAGFVSVKEKKIHAKKVLYPMRPHLLGTAHK